MTYHKNRPYGKVFYAEIVRLLQYCMRKFNKFKFFIINDDDFLLLTKIHDDKKDQIRMEKNT